MLTDAITAGLGLLLVGGVLQLSRGGLGGTRVKRAHLVSEDVTVLSREDLRRPARLLADGEKLRNVATMALELAVVAGAALVVAAVYTTPGVPLVLELLTVGTLLVGVALVGRGLYVRSGLYRPRLEGRDDYRRSLAKRLGADVGREFSNVHAALSEARGPEDDVDETMACVLAATRAGCSLEELTAWVETVGAADPERVREQVEQLSRAKLVAVEDGRLQPGELVADVDHDQLAAAGGVVLD